jgi:hypothetical protein
MTAEIDGDFVVFLIGTRFNNKLRLLRSMLDLGGRRGIVSTCWTPSSRIPRRDSSATRWACR